MIAKAVKGRGFRGALDYDMGKEHGRVLDTNMAGDTPRQLAAEFAEIRKLRPNLGKAVLHVSLSAAPGEHLTDEQWQAIGKQYLDGMGMEKNQYVMTRHTDTEHEHIHLVVNRIRLDGSVTSDSQDYRRQEVVMRDLERVHDLQRVASSLESQRRAPTKGEIEQVLRTGEPSTKQQLQALCDAAAKKCRGIGQYQERLESVGVELVPVVQLDGAKLSGLSYRLGDTLMKGSDLGKRYSPAGLAKHGVMYEQDRDYAGIRRAGEREAHRALEPADRGRADGQSAERRGLGDRAGTDGSSDGRLDGRGADDAGGRLEHKPGAEQGARATDGRDGGGGEGAIHCGSGERERVGQRVPVDGLAALPAHDRDRAFDGTSRDRLLALAGTDPTGPAHHEHGGPESIGGLLGTQPDRSTQALQKQIAALGVSRVEVRLHDRATGKATTREWSSDAAAKAATWLKRMNARGNDVHIRPVGEHGLVLIGGLNAEAITRMKANGWAPAATIETHPGNHQAWVKLSTGTVDVATRKAVAEGLIKSYGGTVGEQQNPWGRLAGLTNQDQQYVLARDCTGATADRGAPVLAKAAEMRAASIAKERQQEQDKIDARDKRMADELAAQTEKAVRVNDAREKADAEKAAVKATKRERDGPSSGPSR